MLVVVDGKMRTKTKVQRERARGFRRELNFGKIVRAFVEANYSCGVLRWPLHY